MKIALTGSSGLIGAELRRRLLDAGDDVLRLVRRGASAPDELAWDPIAGRVATDGLEGVDAVVHLGAESIAEGRWTAAKMDRIRRSRVEGTRVLCDALARLERKPKVLVCASAIGFYGDRDDAAQDERSSAGSGFLADVCRAWEDACEPARAAGIRVVNLRIGVVLSRDGGALAKMLLPFQLGLAGRIGSGRQWMSWIDLDDVVHAIRHSIDTESLRGPVNAVSPKPVTNLDFTKALGRVLSRPTFLPMPRFAARAALGKMADELLLASIRVQPSALLASDFQFRHADLDSSLRNALGRSA